MEIKIQRDLILQLTLYTYLFHEAESFLRS